MSMIILNMVGNLVRDPELKTVNTATGPKTNCVFVVAANDQHAPMGKDGKRVPSYVRVTAWGKAGEACAKYLSKGKQVFVEGWPKASAYQSKIDNGARASLDLSATRVNFLSPSGNTAKTAPAGVAATQAAPAATYEPEYEFDTEMDLPY